MRPPKHTKRAFWRVFCYIYSINLFLKAMKTIQLRPVLLVFLFAITVSFNPPAEKVEWMTFMEAVEKATTDENPKKIFIDVYTDWCG